MLILKRDNFLIFKKLKFYGIPPQVMPNDVFYKYNDHRKHPILAYVLQHIYNQTVTPQLIQYIQKISIYLP